MADANLDSVSNSKSDRRGRIFASFFVLRRGRRDTYKRKRGEREDIEEEVERVRSLQLLVIEDRLVHAVTDDRSRLLPQLVLPDTPVRVAPQVLGGAG